MHTSFEFSTGRHYGKAQVLVIMPETAGEDSTTYLFTDLARGITAIVDVWHFGRVMTNAEIGRAVLAEYDSGRYSLV